MNRTDRSELEHADRAYQKAEKAIADAAAKKATRLDLSSIVDLETLPPAIESLTQLEELRLGWLGLGTKISKIDGVANLPNLTSLNLNNTLVDDISALKDISTLQSLNLNNTLVRDLAPIKHLSFERTTPYHSYGIHFRHTPFARQSESLTKLSVISDNLDRTKALLDFLNDTPSPSIDEHNADDALKPFVLTSPAESQNPIILAPLQVEEDSGRLKIANTPDHLTTDSSKRAREAHLALVEFLGDLSDDMPRIHNSMPKLAKSIERFRSALGADYESMRHVAAGIQATRILRLSKVAGEYLMDEDAEDLAAFTDTLSLFMDRFPEWQVYRQEAKISSAELEALSRQLKNIEDLTQEIATHVEIAPDVAEDLTEQAAGVEEEPQDPLIASGLLASISNVLSVLATKAIPVWTWIKKESGEISQLTFTGARKVIATGVLASMSGLAGAAADIFLNKAGMLRIIAQEFPSKLGWLTKLLNGLGL